jgi:RNA polymerase sigma factor (sigma-70 family)
MRAGDTRRVMSEHPKTGRGSAKSQETAAGLAAVSAWFVREVLPLEALLMHFLHHNWHNSGDIADLRQDVYVRVYEAAQKQIPDHTKRFVLTTARNLLIDRVRREQVVPIDVVSDVDALGVAMDAPGPDHALMAREELRRLQAALDRLPLRCREAVILGHIEGLSGQQIASRMGVAEPTVSEHLTNGIRALTNMLYGEPADRGSKS